MSEILYSKCFEIKPKQPDLGLYESLYGFKRDLILFDKIVFPNLDKFCHQLASKEGRKLPFETQLVIKELQSLKDKGLVRDFQLYQNHHLYGPLLKSMSSENEMLTGTLLSVAQKYAVNLNNLVKNKATFLQKWKDEKEYDRVYWELSTDLEKLETILVTKLIAYHEGADIIDFFPVQKGQITRIQDAEGNDLLLQPKEKEVVDQHNAYCFVLNELSLPSDSTPWEAILDYRSDSDNRLRLSRMRSWIRKTLKEEYSTKELQQEYEHLYLEFENSMKYHKIKNHKTTLKVFMTAIPEFAGNLLAFRWGEIGKGIYNSIVSASLEQVQLYESETGSPGKEVAYNFFANEKFQQ